MNSTLKWLIPVAILGLVVMAFYGKIVGFNNTAIHLQQDSKSAWGNVESSYQRRNDLIPNLVEVVKGYTTHEKSTLTDVIEARAKATSISIDPSKVTPAQLEAFQKSQSGVSSALGRLLVSVERYPDLKANEQFIKLQTELVGTENRIKTARDRYNESVLPYNTHILSFPNSVLAGWFGFKELPYYKSDPGAEKAPKVKF
ncbi:MAG: LemA family protein [Methanobacterium sp.]